MPKRTPEVEKLICDYLRQGNSNVDAALLADIDESTFYDWMKIPSFGAAVAKARLQAKASSIACVKRAQLGLKTIKTVTVSGGKTTTTIIEHPGDAAYALEYLKRRYPEEWGDHLTVALEDLSVLTVGQLEQLEEIEAALDAARAHPRGTL